MPLPVVINSFYFLFPPGCPTFHVLIVSHVVFSIFVSSLGKGAKKQTPLDPSLTNTRLQSKHKMNESDPGMICVCICIFICICICIIITTRLQSRQKMDGWHMSLARVMEHWNSLLIMITIHTREPFSCYKVSVEHFLFWTRKQDPVHESANFRQLRQELLQQLNVLKTSRF